MLKTKHFGTLKTFIITDGAPTSPWYTVVSPAENLPTSEPASGTGCIEYTIAQDHLPTFSSTPVAVKYNIVVLVWGGNGGSSRVANWNSYYDGSLVTMATHTYTTTNTYWTLGMCYAAVSDPVGKTVKFNVWDTAGSLNLMGYAVLVYATQIQLESQKLLYGFRWGNQSMHSPLAGKSGVNQGGANDFYVRYDEYNTGYFQVELSKKAVYSDPYILQHNNLDYTSSNKVMVSSRVEYYPHYIHPQYPHTFTYRVLCEGKL